MDDKRKIMKKIAETSKVIRAKHRALKENKMDQLESLNELYQPIVAPLKKLVSATEHEQTVNAYDDNDDDDDDKITTNISAIQPIKKKLRIKTPIQTKKLRFITSTPTSTAIPLLPPQPPQPSSLPPPPPPPSPPQSRFEESTAASQLSSSNQSVETSIRSLPSPLLRSALSSIYEQSLREIVQTQPEEVKKLFKDLGPIGREYIKLFLTDSKNKIDYVFGVKFKDKELMLGNSKFSLDKNDNIIINDKKYRGTRGLFELIFKKVPISELYTEVDLNKYREILNETNAHRQGNCPSRQLLSNRGFKYKSVIAPLFASAMRSGQGFGDTNVVTGNPRDYVYWDDPNELVNRLRLLIASQAAGHMGHENEIASLIEELREADLIV